MKKETKSKNLDLNLPIEVDYIEPIKQSYKLVFSVVKKGYAYEVVKAAANHNSHGATILEGKAPSGERKKLFGIDISPERECVMMVVEEKLVYPVIKEIYAIANFKSNAKGVVFVLPIDYLLD